MAENLDWLLAIVTLQPLALTSGIISPIQCKCGEKFHLENMNHILHELIMYEINLLRE